MHSISRAASAFEQKPKNLDRLVTKNILEPHLENQIEMLQQKNQLRKQFRLGYNPPNWEA